MISVQKQIERLEEIKEERKAIEDQIDDLELESDELWTEQQNILDELKDDPEYQAYVNDQRNYERTRFRLAQANGGKLPKTLKGFEWWKVPLYPVQ